MKIQPASAYPLADFDHAVEMIGFVVLLRAREIIAGNSAISEQLV
jgi:hypothetical protein